MWLSVGKGHKVKTNQGEHSLAGLMLKVRWGGGTVLALGY